MEILLAHPYLLGLFLLVMTVLVVTDTEDERPIAIRAEDRKPERRD